MTIESVKVVPTAKEKVENVTQGPPHTTKVKKGKGDIVFDDELQDYEGNIEDKAVVVVSHIEEETVLIEPNNPYSKTKVIKTKVYETVPYDDDIKAYLIKSGKFGGKLDGYINGVVNQSSGNTSMQQQPTSKSRSQPDNSFINPPPTISPNSTASSKKKNSKQKEYVWTTKDEDGTKRKIVVYAETQKDAEEFMRVGEHDLIREKEKKSKGANSSSGGAYKIK